MLLVLNSLFLIISSLLCHNGIGAAIRIKITPHEYDGTIPYVFDVQCAPDETESYAKKIVVMQVSRNGEKPLVTLQQNSDLTYGRLLESSVTAQGHIDRVPEKSYLNITFTNAMKEDSGQYTCSMYYLDHMGHMKEDRAGANFIVEHQGVEDVVRYLTAKVTTLEELVEYLQNTTNTLANQNQGKTDKTMHAFMAGYNAADGIVKGKVLKFRNVLMRVGNGFDESQGIFTAPVDGLYTFHLFIWTSSGKGVYVDIKVNNDTRARVYAGDRNHQDQTSVSRMIILNTGDKVQCVPSTVDSGVSLLSYPSSGFSGFLIQAI